jgi:hypothetical protein
MVKDNKTQKQLIETSVGNQYMATYAGTIGCVMYYECKDPVSGNSVGVVATVVQGKFGPMCHDCVAAVMRARNIVGSISSLWTRLFFGRQK